jgi:hypothetical protein
MIKKKRKVGPVRCMIFTEGNHTSYSSGKPKVYKVWDVDFIGADTLPELAAKIKRSRRFTDQQKKQILGV